MKQQIAKGLVILLALAGANTSLAQTQNRGATTTRNTPSGRVTETREKIVENVRRIIENRYEKMLDRYEAIIDRENAITNRITSRIEKIKALGGNTAEAEKLVTEAKMHLDMATSSLAVLKTLADKQNELENSSTTVKTLRDGLVEMRKAGAEVEKHLRNAHQALQKTIGSLRGVSQLKNKNATTTN